MDKLNITKYLPDLNIEKVEKLQEVLLNLSSVLSTIQA